MIRIVFTLLCMCATASAQSTRPSNVIFIHPDGTSISQWTATRMLYVGPDAQLNWDKLEHVAVYRGHMLDALVATSNGGATTHAFGRKVPASSFGKSGREALTSASGEGVSIMREAIAKGHPCGIVNSGSAIEPGTACFLASVDRRDNFEAITAQLIESGANVILGGGEEWFVPKGKSGRHGEGSRTDGRDLVSEARSRGYTVVFNRAELLALPEGTTKVLGLFARDHTFNAMSEEKQKEQGLANYLPDAPTVAEMTQAAVRILSRGDKPFLLVVEEEGTDNFGNHNHANGTLEALKRADDAIGVALAFLGTNPNTLILTAADSDAGGLAILSFADSRLDPEKPLPARESNGAPLDGVAGTGTLPFLSQPDQFGKRHAFAITWAATPDVHGSVVIRAHGAGAERVRGTMDNTDIYRVMYKALLGDLKE